MFHGIMEEKTTTWLTDELFDLVDNDVADFAFEQGEKYMREQEDTAKAIVNRAYLILGAAVTVCPLLITTSLTSENAFLKCMSYFLTAFCTGLSIYLMGIVKPGKTSSMGREPKDLLREEVLKHHRDTGCNIKLYELENLQRKIDNLEKENAAKSKQLKTALYATLFLVFLCLIVASFD